MNIKRIEELRYYSRELIREFGFLDTTYQRYDLNVAQIHLLLECERYGSIDQQTLAKNLRVNKSYVSRLVKSLLELELTTVTDNPADNRIKNVILTSKGHIKVKEINDIAQKQVVSALHYLTEEEQIKVNEGLNLYSQALKKGRKLEGVIIRPIQQEDNGQMSVIIKSVLIEYGANKPGFAFTDEETNALFDAYQGNGKQYFVAEHSNRLLGGIGFGPLQGAASTICELRKMYLVKEARGLGLGDELLCFAEMEAKKSYTHMYLETLSSMTQAISIYRRRGFDFLQSPLGDTGHYSCDTWMIKDIIN